MTIRGRFFTREEYFGHVYGALVDFPGRIRTLPPAILKPSPLWSGKQIISTIILNLVPEDKEPPTLESTAKVKPHLFEKEEPRPCKAGGEQLGKTAMSESEVIFRQGEFMGFTLGVEDILVTDIANRQRRKTIRKTRKQGLEMAANGVGVQVSEGDAADKEEVATKLEQYHRESRAIPKRRMDIDRAYKDKLAPATNDINGVCIPRGLIKRFPDNNLQLMVQAGAKGSTVNTMQISSLLGQIELEGKPLEYNNY